MDKIGLAALGEEEIGGVWAHHQDALLKVKDIAFLARERRFVVAMNRFVWERAARAANGGEHERRLTGFHVDRVLSVRSRGIDRASGETVLSLLAVTFEPDEARPPSGTVVLAFAADKEVRLAVECLEVGMKDLGPAWSTPSKPSHGAA